VQREIKEELGGYYDSFGFYNLLSGGKYNYNLATLIGIIERPNISKRCLENLSQ
jgi:hypothetical protein